jgi:hypothetical protein
MNASPPPGHAPTERSKVFPGLLIGAVTAPVLVGIVLGKALAQAAQELGQLSEEVFRGDRLPLLKFPSQPDGIPDSAEDD